MEDALIASALQHDLDPNIRRAVALGKSISHPQVKNNTSPLEVYLTNLATKYQSQQQVVKLYQSDFNRGTYRITKPGLYQLQESIVFHPQPTHDLFPTDLQLQGEYPGRPGPYSLGFFAAITVEAKDVILDLGGHTIQQSVEFYAIQR